MKDASHFQVGSEFSRPARREVPQALTLREGDRVSPALEILAIYIQEAVFTPDCPFSTLSREPHLAAKMLQER